MSHFFYSHHVLVALLFKVLAHGLVSKVIFKQVAAFCCIWFLHWI